MCRQKEDLFPMKRCSFCNTTHLYPYHLALCSIVLRYIFALNEPHTHHSQHALSIEPAATCFEGAAAAASNAKSFKR